MFLQVITSGSPPTHNIICLQIQQNSLQYKDTKLNHGKSYVDLFTIDRFHVSTWDLLNIALHPLFKLASDVLDLPLC